MTMKEYHIEKRFSYKGFPCVCLFLPWGYRCGYVGLPSSHKYYGVDYSRMNIDCHGGLTYSEGWLYGQSDTDTWWIGFDCGHWDDGVDRDAQARYFWGESVPPLAYAPHGIVCMLSAASHGVVRTLEYVEQQCRYIVDQLL